MDNIYVVSPTVALTVSVILQVLKNSSYFPWLTRNTGKLNAVVAGLIAIVSSLGIVGSFDMAADGTFAGEFHGNLYDIGHVIGHAVIQWAEQHAFYKQFIAQPEILGEIRATLQANQQAMVTGLLDTSKTVSPKPKGDN